jgi:hypothetical protein
MAQQMKPYVKLASTLASVGLGIFFIEQFALGEFKKNGSVHLDGTLLSIMVLAPIVLVVAGAIVFLVGKMRRL